MRRHRIHVPSPLQHVIVALREVPRTIVELTEPDRGLVHLEDGVGLLHHQGGITVLDLLEFNEGRHVHTVIKVLRGAGFQVNHRAT